MSQDQDRWNLTEADRAAVIAAVMVIIEGDDRPLALRAVRCVMEMENLNLQFDARVEKKLRNRVGRLRVAQ